MNSHLLDSVLDESGWPVGAVEGMTVADCMNGGVAVVADKSELPVPSESDEAVAREILEEFSHNSSYISSADEKKKLLSILARHRHKPAEMSNA